jgi:hypothetical protein
MIAWRLFVSQELQNYNDRHPTFVSYDSVLKTLKGSGRTACPTRAWQPQRLSTIGLSISARLFGRFRSWFLTNFFLNFASPFPGEPRTKDSVEQIGQK